MDLEFVVTCATCVRHKAAKRCCTQALSMPVAVRPALTIQVCRSMVSWSKGLLWDGAHWQSAHEPDACIPSCFPSRSLGPRTTSAMPWSGWHGLGAWQGSPVVRAYVLNLPPCALCGLGDFPTQQDAMQRKRGTW